MVKQFIKTSYINRKSSDDGYDKVIIVFKNEDGTKEQKVIEKPVLSFYKTKPEFDDGQYHNYIEKEKVEEVKVYNKDIYKGIAKSLNDKNIDYLLEQGFSGGSEAYSKLRDIHLDRRLHGSDINIEDLYINKFINKNDPEKVTNKLNKGFFDIEVDGTQVEGFPDQEEAKAEINVITYVDLASRNTYTYMLNYDTKTFTDTLDDLEGVQRDLHKKYNEFVGGKYSDFSFNFFVYDNELGVIKGFLEQVVQKSKPDFCSAWNLDYDYPTIYNRLKRLGVDPAELLCDKDSKYKKAFYKIDKLNSDPADRSSVFEAVGTVNWVDQLAIYSNVTRMYGKLESYSLDYVGEHELQEHKDVYEGSIRDLHFRDYRTFLIYNIQDTMLLMAIEDKNNHLELIHNVATMTATRIGKALKATINLRNLASIFYEQQGFHISNNRSRLYPKTGEKIPGGFVGDPNLIQKVGMKTILGNSDKIFESVIDFDLSSLYPSIIQAFNISPETNAGDLEIGHIELNNMNDQKFIDETPDFVDKYNSNNDIKFGIDYYGLPDLVELEKLVKIEMEK